MLVEYWLWRYEDPFTGQLCTTATHMTANDAASLPKARRISGTVVYRDLEAEFGLNRHRSTDPTERSGRSS